MRAPKPLKQVWLLFCPRAGIYLQAVYGLKSTARIFAEGHQCGRNTTPAICGAYPVKVFRAD